MEHILFVIKSNCKNRDISEMTYLPPIGVMSIATTLELHGYKVEIIDQSVTLISAESILNKINENKPLFVGVSAYTENIDEVLKLCKYIKSNRSKTKIMLGGPHPTLEPDYCKKARLVDFIVKGEGEIACLELAEAIRTNQSLIRYEDIKGLIYKSNNKEFKDAKETELICDLDLLPIIKRSYIDRALKSVFVTISSSRGCPGRCIYCAAPSMAGKKYRVRDIENVIMETLLVLNLTDYKKEIYYIDDTFTAIISRVKKFIDIIRDLNIKMTFRCESRVDVLYKNKNIIDDLIKIGCQRLQYGIESGNQIVLDKIFKQMDLKEAEELIEYTVNVGGRVAASFIFGHYCDTPESMNDTVEFMKKLHKKHGERIELVSGYNTPFPGTYQYEFMKELGMNLKINNYEELSMVNPVVETDNFTMDSQIEYNNKARAVMNI